MTIVSVQTIPACISGLVLFSI